MSYSTNVCTGQDQTRASLDELQTACSPWASIDSIFQPLLALSMAAEPAHISYGAQRE